MIMVVVKIIVIVIVLIASAEILSTNVVPLPILVLAGVWQAW